MQALSSYSAPRHEDVARALASLRSPADGLSAEAFVTAQGFFARFIWPDLPVGTSAKLGGLIGALHARHRELNMTLGVTPAMEAGTTDHVWTFDELLCAAWYKRNAFWIPT
jgi:hypothetical protein